MTFQKNCSQCGTPIGPDLQGSVCAACLLEEGLEGASAADLIEGDQRKETKIFGDYELLEEIGRGGMGVIYKARQAGLNRIVALKMLLAGEFADAAGREQLLREARVAATLYHANIVTIHEVGEHEGRPYFAMQYISGRNLSEIVKDGPLAIETAVRYVEQLARAVHYAHDHDVVHRDLKPANVLVDAQGEPKLTDFGLTKWLGDQTLTIVTAGSPNFMAPEQAASDRGSTGRHTDIFGLGGILYYLLTGVPPFAGQLLGETLKAVLDQDPIPPRKLRARIPADLETICLKCLEKNARDRYESASEVAEELERWRKHEPILARASGPAERARKWIKREPVLAGLIFACLVLATLAAALFSRERTLNEKGNLGGLPRLEQSDTRPLFAELPTTNVKAEKGLVGIAITAFDSAPSFNVAAISLTADKLQIFHAQAGSALIPAASYPTGKRPQGIAAGDIQGDGRVDLVCANMADDSVSLFFGGPDGTFEFASTAIVGKGPRGVVLTDVNGDRILDLLTSDYDGNTLSILLGDGRGAFSKCSTVKTGTHPWGLAVADFDHDARMDLINTDVSDFTVRVWKGNGHGGFELAKGFPVRVGSSPISVAVADLDGDRKSDIVTTDTNDGTITILFGTGRRLTLPAGAPFPQSSYPRSLVIADLNRDGFLDIVTANEGGSIGLMLGDGHGNFARDVNSPYPAGPGVRSLAVTDVNGDGWPDIIAGRGTDEEGAVLILLNQSGISKNEKRGRQ